MDSNIIVIMLGIIILGLGIANMMGHIETLHSYHRHRVSAEDRKPFGRVVGLGHVIVGAGIILYGVLFFAHERTQLAALGVIAPIVLIGGIVVGLGMAFYGMIKYNKGIF